MAVNILHRCETANNPKQGPFHPLPRRNKRSPSPTGSPPPSAAALARASPVRSVFQTSAQTAQISTNAPEPPRIISDIHRRRLPKSSEIANAIPQRLRRQQRRPRPQPHRAQPPSPRNGINPSDSTPQTKTSSAQNSQSPHSGAYFCTNTSVNPNDPEVASAAPMLNATRAPMHPRLIAQDRSPQRRREHRHPEMRPATVRPASSTENPATHNTFVPRIGVTTRHIPRFNARNVNILPPQKTCIPPAAACIAPLALESLRMHRQHA